MTKVVVIEGPSGIGKTRLLAEYEEIARLHDFPVRTKNIKQYMSVDNLLQSIEEHFGGPVNFPEFNSYKDRRQDTLDNEYCRLLGRCFMKDLDKLRPDSQLLLIMDKFEKADNLLRDWLSKHFLADIVRKQPHLLAVVAGENKPTLDYDADWIKQFSLGRVSLESWSAFLQRQGICIPEREIAEAYEDGEGVPYGLRIVLRRLNRAASAKEAAGKGKEG
jgi:AAA domain-containing protein